MPKRPLRPCRYPGCPELIEGGGYCDKHKRQERKRHDDNRPGARQRGYDKRWEKVRAQYIAEHPLCERCEAKGLITPTAMVHHKIPISQGGKVLDKSNLMSVCRRCHDVLHSQMGK